MYIRKILFSCLQKKKPSFEWEADVAPVRGSANRPRNVIRHRSGSSRLGDAANTRRIRLYVWSRRRGQVSPLRAPPELGVLARSETGVGVGLRPGLDPSGPSSRDHPLQHVGRAS